MHALVFLGYLLQSQITEWQGVCIFSLENIYQLSYKTVVVIHTTISSVQSVFTHTHTYLYLPPLNKKKFKNFTNLMASKLYLVLIFTCFSTSTSETKLHLILLLAICIVSFRTFFFVPFARFTIVYFLLFCSALYLYAYYPLYAICTTRIFLSFKVLSSKCLRRVTL